MTFLFQWKDETIVHGVIYFAFTANDDKMSRTKATLSLARLVLPVKILFLSETFQQTPDAQKLFTLQMGRVLSCYWVRN